MEIFKELHIGGVPKEQLIQRLVAAGIRFNDYARVLFEHPAFSPGGAVEKLRLVRVMSHELGLENPYSLETALRLASDSGLRPCPLHLAAFLRLEYPEQPEGPYLTVVSARPESDENFPTGFYVRNFEGSLWLRGYRAIGACEHPADNEFVFLG